MLRGMRRVGCLLVLAMVFGGCSSDDGGGGAGATAGSGCPNDGSGYDSDAQRLECEVLTLVNQVRAQGATCGGEAMPAVGALTMNAPLRTVARNHAIDMATHNYFSHDSQNGTTAFERMTAAGYSYSTAGENIAAGSSTAQGVMDQWMNSPGHCANIMSGSYKEIGIGYRFNEGSDYGHYWVQDFGSPR
ncbi:MAG: CAP domain-containing protein [Polyangiaceae bacterium]|nr:CAP domain-containing protein [Polyangiaceae bacterium]